MTEWHPPAPVGGSFPFPTGPAGTDAVAIGAQTAANAPYSVALGQEARAEASASTAIGSGVVAEVSGQVSLGPSMVTQALPESRPDPLAMPYGSVTMWLDGTDLTFEVLDNSNTPHSGSVSLS